MEEYAPRCENVGINDEKNVICKLGISSCLGCPDYLTTKKEPVVESPAAMAGSTALQVSINQKCRIKVLIRGVDAYNKYYADLGMEPFKELRPNDIYEAQLLGIMEIFGEACRMGPEPPFETNIEILPLQ